ncbi:MAG: GNAT family N-acetyltransferase [Ferruginibacter sp.]
MLSLNYTSSNSEADLSGIIGLQKNNVSANLTSEEISSQGFVTVIHSLEDLKKMNDVELHIICKDGEKVVAYLLAMTEKSKDDIPVLVPMFEIFNEVLFMERPVSTYKYIVVGQVCVDKDYRGMGVLDKCYEMYKNTFRGRYHFAITEIASRNIRSINAHKRIGFNEIHKYTSPEGEDWSIVLWQW